VPAGQCVLAAVTSDTTAKIATTTIDPTTALAIHAQQRRRRAVDSGVCKESADVEVDCRCIWADSVAVRLAGGYQRPSDASHQSGSDTDGGSVALSWAWPRETGLWPLPR
jgi:hypothetical protein